MLQSVKLADSTFSWLFDPPFDNDLIVLIQFTSYFQMTIFLFYSKAPQQFFHPKK